MMIYLWASVLIICVAFCLYIAIQSRKYPLVMFILVPMLLVASVYSVNVFYHIQGTPKHELPQGQIEILYVAIAKPNIYLLVKEDDATHPVYYRIDYTTQRAQQMRKLMQQMGTEQLRGNLRFKGDGELTTKEDIVFENIKNTPLPPKEN